MPGMHTRMEPYLSSYPQPMILVVCLTNPLNYKTNAGARTLKYVIN